MLRLHHIDEAPDGSYGPGGQDWLFEDSRLTLEQARDEPAAPGGDWYYGAGEDAGSTVAAPPCAGNRAHGSILTMLAEAVPGDHRRIQAAYSNFPQPAPMRPLLRAPNSAPRSGFGWVGTPPRRPRSGGWASYVAYGSLTLILVASLGLAIFAGVHSAPRSGPGAQTATVEIQGEGVRP